jgi:hypothetical protein
MANKVTKKKHQENTMKKNHVFKFSALVTAFAVMALVSINATASNNGKRPGPPPEAITACKGKEVGDAVTFTGRNKDSIEAVCKEIEGQLVAVPNNMPPQGPPQQ